MRQANIMMREISGSLVPPSYQSLLYSSQPRAALSFPSMRKRRSYLSLVIWLCFFFHLNSLLNGTHVYTVVHSAVLTCRTTFCCVYVSPPPILHGLIVASLSFHIEDTHLHLHGRQLEMVQVRHSLVCVSRTIHPNDSLITR